MSLAGSDDILHPTERRLPLAAPSGKILRLPGSGEVPLRFRSNVSLQ